MRRTLSLIAAFTLFAARCHAFAPIVHKHAISSPKLSKTYRFVNCFSDNQASKWAASRGSSTSLSDSLTDLATSLFRYQGPIPLVQAFGINAVLFALLQGKLNTMLTPSGFTSSLILGTGLWATLGWRGWTLCVLYLFLGQAVTKVRFEEKEKRGIAEGRGGRRGPENVWYVHVVNVSPYPYSF